MKYLNFNNIKNLIRIERSDIMVRNRSVFPNDIDSFNTLYDLPPSLANDANELNQLQMIENKTQIQIDRMNQLLVELQNYLLTSETVNYHNDCITNMENFTKNRITNYYNYKKQYNNTQTYEIFNTVTFTDGCVYLLYNVLPDYQAGINPTNTDYWIKISSKGDKGTKWKSNYDVGINYMIDDLVNDEGSVYICISPCIGQKPSTSPTYWGLFVAKGISGQDGVGLNFVGEYVSTATYNTNKAIQYLGSLYACMQDGVSGIAPDPNGDTQYWKLVVAKGSSTITKMMRNEVIVTTNTSNVNFFGGEITAFNPNLDSFFMFKNSTYKAPNTYYTINGNGVSIDKVSGTWDGTVAPITLQFVVIKNVIQNINFNDGSLIQDGSIQLSKLNTFLQQQINKIGIDSLNTTAQDLSGAINEHEVKINNIQTDFTSHLADKTNKTDLDATNKNIGDKSQLNTNDKSSIVKAVNEVKTQANTTDIGLQTTNNTVSNLQTQVTNMASGSPKGTYDTLSNLQTAYPTGTTGIFIITNDSDTTKNGHWFYWNGSIWADGGVYQATEIPDYSIGNEKLKDLSITGAKAVNNTFGLAKLNLVHWNRPYFTDTIVYDKNTETITIPDVFCKNSQGGFITITASQFPEQHPNGVFDFKANNLSKLFFDTASASNGLYPFVFTVQGNTQTQDGDRYIEILSVKDNGIMSNYKVEYASIAIEKVNVFDVWKNKILVPDKLFLIDEEPLRIYKSSSIKNPSYSFGEKMAIISTKDGEMPYYEYVNGKLELEVDKLGTSAMIGVIPEYTTWTNGSFWGKQVQIIHKSANTVTNKSPNAIFFGDSLTWKGTPTKTKEFLNTYGITLNSIGTATDAFSTNCEGRSGWTFAQYIGLRTTDTTTETLMTSFPSFLKLATADDRTNHPTWCFRRTGVATEKSYATDTDKTGDFYIFDFANYLTVNGFNSPDIAIISMSTNDFWKYSEADATANCKLAIEIMTKQILSVCPNCKIGIIPHPAYASTNDNLIKAGTWNGVCQNFVASLALANVDIIGAWMSQSSELSFALSSTYDSVDIHGYRQNDTIHPTIWGTMECSKSIAFYMINQLS